MDSLESQEDGEGNVWKFHWVTGHQGPLLHNDKDYNGSLYNVMIEWENGEVTAEPLFIIAKDDPMTRVKHLYGYLPKMKAGVIHIQTGESDYSALPDQAFDWERSVYVNVSEILLSDVPKPLGKHLLIGTIRSRLWSRLPPMVLSLLLCALVLIRLLISVLLCITLVFLSGTRAMFLVTTRWVWTALLFRMQSCTNITMHCHSIMSEKLLLPSSLQCIILMVSSTLLTSSASIGHICQIWHNLKPLLFFPGNMAQLYDED
jgi:hypothetical protein